MTTPLDETARLAGTARTSDAGPVVEGARPGDGGEPSRVLLVDDNPTNLQVLYRTLAPCGYRLFVARSGDEALRIACEIEPHLVLMDVMMPGPDGYATCEALRADPRTASAAVLFVTALEATADKVRGFDLGGVDYVTKPFDAHEVRARVATQLRIKMLERDLRERNARLAHELDVVQAQLDEALQQHGGVLVGTSEAVRRLDQEIRDAAGADGPVLLIGPAGCEPEGVARLIHCRSARGGRAFLTHHAVVRAGQPPEYLRERFALARGGTLYVEQVGALTTECQAVMLEELDRDPATQPRVVCYAPDELVTDVVRRRFRADLMGRLVKRTVRLPPLAARREDIGAIARDVLGRTATRLERPAVALSADALAVLENHAWPGNLRELQVAVERAVLAAPDSVVAIDASDLAGVREIGGYKLVEKLGEGGMGEVWRARHQLLARPAAVKLVRSSQLERMPALEVHRRFREEARATARLRSPHTIELYDFGVDYEGTWFYVMELLDGIDLKRLVERFGPQPPERVVHLLAQACRSLEEAHATGLVHRDIKPANLFACRLGTSFDVLKVLDFGLVGTLGDSAGGTPERGAQVVGTPPYMAPEALTGEGPCDHRADLYALGCVGYYLLSGRHAYEASTVPMLVYMKSFERPAPLSPECVLPAALERVIERCLENRPDDRYASAAEILAALRAIDVATAWTEERAAAWWETHLPVGRDG